MKLLRFITAGSVDDGKSTLIGRLFLDSKAIFADQLTALEQASARIGTDEVNLALFTDGLKAERDQGITIDVAYRYFSTPRRKFIIADTPGHIEYTRNMVTGASTCDAAVILIDARHGIAEQTRRHTYIIAMLQVTQVILAVNKMDLVDFSPQIFEEICAEYRQLTGRIGLQGLRCIPICARDGDNVVSRSERMAWYQGPALLEALETLEVSAAYGDQPLRYDVQYVLRPHSDQFHDYRGYAGQAVAGSIRVGQEITVLPSGRSSRVRSINIGRQEVSSAAALQAAAVCLEDDLDVARGCLLAARESLPLCGRSLVVMVCVLSNQGLRPNTPYDVRHLSAELQGMITAVQSRIDIDTFDSLPGGSDLQANDIARVQLMLSSELYYDRYRDNRMTGSLILIDRLTHETAAVGLIEG